MAALGQEGCTPRYRKNGQSFAGRVCFVQILLELQRFIKSLSQAQDVSSKTWLVYLQVQTGVGLPLVGPHAN